MLRPSPPTSSSAPASWSKPSSPFSSSGSCSRLLADPRGSYTAIAGLAVGFAITFDILVGGPLTGAAMNPARAFGPELVANVWDDFWIWYVGPLAGGAIAALLYDELYLRSAKPVPVGPPETGVEEPGAGMAATEVRVGVESPPPPDDRPLYSTAATIRFPGAFV